MKVNIFRGELTDNSAKKEALYTTSVLSFNIKYVGYSDPENIPLQNKKNGLLGWCNNVSAQKSTATWPQRYLRSNFLRLYGKCDTFKGKTNDHTGVHDQNHSELHTQLASDKKEKCGCDELPRFTAGDWLQLENMKITKITTHRSDLIWCIATLNVFTDRGQWFWFQIT